MSVLRVWLPRNSCESRGQLIEINNLIPFDPKTYPPKNKTIPYSALPAASSSSYYFHSGATCLFLVMSLVCYFQLIYLVWVLLRRSC